MDEVGWLGSRIEFNKELLWSARQRSSGLQDHRASIAGLWDDSAARHVRQRYLTPHEEDDTRLLERLVAHAEALARALGAIERAQVAAAAADGEAIALEDHLSEAAEALRRVAVNIEAALDAESRSTSEASRAELLVVQAQQYER